MHTCPMVTGIVPHVGGPILPPARQLCSSTFSRSHVTTWPPASAPGYDRHGIDRGDDQAFSLPRGLGIQPCMAEVIVFALPPASSARWGRRLQAGRTRRHRGWSRSQRSHATRAEPIGLFDRWERRLEHQRIPEPSADTPQARLQIAQAFYSQTGWSEEKISNHLRGIDFNKPVEVGTLRRTRRSSSGSIRSRGSGNYFDEDAQPEELGLYPTAPYPRELKTFVVSKGDKGAEVDGGRNSG